MLNFMYILGLEGAITPHLKKNSLLLLNHPLIDKNELFKNLNPLKRTCTLQFFFSKTKAKDRKNCPFKEP